MDPPSVSSSSDRHVGRAPFAPIERPKAGGPRYAHPSEAEFARILDFYGLRWEYEPRSFPLRWQGTRILEMFSPDFYLPDLDLYLELTTLKQNLVTYKNRKLRRLRELYPGINIKLLYRRDYQRLLAKYGFGPLASAERGIEKVLIPGDRLRRRVAEMGRQVSVDLAGTDPVFIGVLKGVFYFMADLTRAVTLPLTVEFMSVSYYQDKGGEVRITKGLDHDVKGKHIVLVEDIVDTGLTLNYLVAYLKSLNPASIRICALLDKRVRRIANVPLDYVGFEIPDQFVVGYGLDYEEKYRNLPFIGLLDVREREDQGPAAPMTETGTMRRGAPLRPQEAVERIVALTGEAEGAGAPEEEEEAAAPATEEEMAEAAEGAAVEAGQVGPAEEIEAEGEAEAGAAAVGPDGLPLKRRRRRRGGRRHRRYHEGATQEPVGEAGQPQVAGLPPSPPAATEPPAALEIVQETAAEAVPPAVIEASTPPAGEAPPPTQAPAPEPPQAAEPPQQPPAPPAQPAPPGEAQARSRWDSFLDRLGVVSRPAEPERQPAQESPLPAPMPEPPRAEVPVPLEQAEPAVLESPPTVPPTPPSDVGPTTGRRPPTRRGGRGRGRRTAGAPTPATPQGTEVNPTPAPEGAGPSGPVAGGVPEAASAAEPARGEAPQPGQPSEVSQSGTQAGQPRRRPRRRRSRGGSGQPEPPEEQG